MIKDNTQNIQAKSDTFQDSIKKLQERSLYFVADTHFGSQEAIERDNRAVETSDEAMQYMITQINEKMKHTNNNILIHAGDFINYFTTEPDWEIGIKAAKEINADIILVIGNNERRLLNDKFNNNFQEFRKCFIEHGFKEVYEYNYEVELFEGTKLNVIHEPVHRSKTMFNLFGAYTFSNRFI